MPSVCAEEASNMVLARLAVRLCRRGIELRFVGGRCWCSGIELVVMMLVRLVVRRDNELRAIDGRIMVEQHRAQCSTCISRRWRGAADAFERNEGGRPILLG